MAYMSESTPTALSMHPPIRARRRAKTASQRHSKASAPLGDAARRNSPVVRIGVPHPGLSGTLVGSFSGSPSRQGGYSDGPGEAVACCDGVPSLLAESTAQVVRDMPPRSGTTSPRIQPATEMTIDAQNVDQKNPSEVRPRSSTSGPASHTEN